MDENTTPHDKLRAWLTDNGVSVPDFADAVGVSRIAVYAWMKTAIPSPLRRLAIETATGGAITPSEWAKAAVVAVAMAANG